MPIKMHNKCTADMPTGEDILWSSHPLVKGRVADYNSNRTRKDSLVKVVLKKCRKD